MTDSPATLAIKGRGARLNAAGRYEREAREAFDDGWGDEPPVALDTIVTPEAARRIISSNDSPDISFDQSINAYRGCEHGCSYCYARPNHAYAGLSPGLDFESRLFVKLNAAELLERELAKPGYRPRTIMMSGVTDCYQPIERRYRLTRSCLEVLARWKHPAGIVTKSQLIMRDLDILAPMAAQNLVKAAISLTTLDKALARAMEPRAAAPHRRLAAMRALSQAGVPVAVMTAPIIPGLNDSEIEALLAAAAEAGATEAGYVLLRMPLEIKALFRDWLAQHVPDRAQRVLSLLKQMRGGADYDARWGERMRGSGPMAKLIADRFAAACRRLGLNQTRRRLDTSLFARPPLAGEQQELFG